MPSTGSPPQRYMTLAGHLRELRNRLVKAIGAVIVTTVVAGMFYKQLIDFVIAPLPGCTIAPGGGTGASGRCDVIAASGLLSPFTLALRTSLTAGLIGASPVWLYQLWAFLAPGLHRSEKKYTLVFLATGIPLFLAGAAFAYAILPTTARVLISLTPDKATNILPIEDFLDLATRMVVVFGLSFELPLLLIMLNLAGVLSASRMAGWWRQMVLGVTVPCQSRQSRPAQRQPDPASCNAQSRTDVSGHAPGPTPPHPPAGAPEIWAMHPSTRPTRAEDHDGRRGRVTHRLCSATGTKPACEEAPARQHAPLALLSIPHTPCERHPAANGHTAPEGAPCARTRPAARRTSARGVQKE